MGRHAALITTIATVAIIAIPASAEPSRAGAVGSVGATTPVTSLGADDPAFVLYLRADGALREDGREAIEGALAVLARLPGAGVALYIEPNDRDAGQLAEALTELGTDAQRRSLLAALAEHELPRWSDAGTITRVGRAIGLPLRANVPSARPAYGIVRARAATSGRQLLRRPPGLVTATRTFFALGRRRLRGAELDALLAEQPATPTVSAAPTPAPAGVGRLSPHVVTLRPRLSVDATALDRRDTGALSSALAEAMALAAAGRARLVIEPVLEPTTTELDADATLVARALLLCDAATGARLAQLLAAQPPASHYEAVALLQAAGLDPTAILSDDARVLARRQLARRTDNAPDASAAASSDDSLLLIDGARVSRSELARLWHPPSLGLRLERRPRQP